MANLDIASLIAGLQIGDPRLYQVLEMLNNRLLDVESDLSPLVRQAAQTVIAEAALEPPSGFAAIFTPTTIRFNWTEVIGAAQYEIRKGTVWETADFQLRSSSLQADIDPLLEGTYTYLIKSLSSGGTYSTTTMQCVIVVTPLGFVNITQQVIDNNVLLSWAAPTSVFAISYYEVYRDSLLIGTLLATFFVRFEAVAGTYDFNVVAVDVAGNRSGDATLSVTVKSPPDYVLQDVRTLDFTGTKTRTKKDGPTSLLACLNSETFQNHFLSRVWLTPQNQVSAGYPIYIQPTARDGTYQEVIDYGVVLTNVIITYTYQLEILVDGVLIGISTRVSNDNVSWSAPQTGASFFVASVRYLELTLTFTATT